MKTKIEKLEQSIEEFRNDLDALKKRVKEMEQPVLVEPHDDINIKYMRIWTGEKYKGKAKVLKTYFEEGATEIYHLPTWMRVYELLINDKGREYTATLTQREFEEGIKRAKK